MYMHMYYSKHFSLCTVVFHCSTGITSLLSSNWLAIPFMCKNVCSFFVLVTSISFILCITTPAIWFCGHGRSVKIYQPQRQITVIGWVEDDSQLSTCNKLCSLKREHHLMLYSLFCVTIDFRMNGLPMSSTGITNKTAAGSCCQSLVNSNIGIFLLHTWTGFMPCISL